MPTGNVPPLKTAAQIARLKTLATKYRRAVANLGHGGLSVMVLPSGRRQYLFRYRRPRDGKQTEITLPTFTLTTARELHLQCHEWLRQGKDPARELNKVKHYTADAFTLQELFEQWLRHYATTPSHRTKRLPTPRTVRKQAGRWRLHLKKSLGDLPAREVERWQLVRVLDAIKASAQEEARQCLSVLRGLFAYAEYRGLVPEDPARAIPAERIGLAASRPRERALDLGELRQLWTALEHGKIDPTLLAAIKMLIITGCRRSEVTGMRWEEVSLTTGEWTIPGQRTKNRRAHTVYLPPIAINLLVALNPLTERSGFVFESRRKPGNPIHPDSLTSALERLRGVARPPKGRVIFNKAAPLSALPAFTIHDLRRSARTAWTEHCKIAPHIAEALLNHLPEKLVNTYDKASYRDEKKAGWRVWGELIENSIRQVQGDAADRRSVPCNAGLGAC